MTGRRGWRFPAWRPLTLDNGVRVRLVDMPGRFVASVAVTVALPTAVESQATEGVVWTYTAMMLNDAPHARAAGVDEVARIGATITAGCDHRGPKVMADCPVPELPRLLAALAAMMLSFDPTDRSFDACRLRAESERAFERHDPYALANKLLNETVIDSSSRYSRSVNGTSSSWSQLTLADVNDLFHRHVDPRLLTVIVVADLSLLSVAAVVEETFGAFPPRSRPAVQDHGPLPGPVPMLSHRDGPDGRQTRLMLGCFAIDRRDPRWPSARVAAEMLGGSPDTVLNAELRGRLGLTYGVEAKFLPYFSGGLFVVTGTVDDARSEEAVNAICRVLSETLQDGFEATQFQATRGYMVSSAPESYESTLTVAYQHAELVSCGIEEGFVDAQLARLRELTVSRVDEDLRSLLDPASLHAAVIGRFDPDRSVLAGLARVDTEAQS